MRAINFFIAPGSQQLDPRLFSMHLVGMYEKSKALWSAVVYLIIAPLRVCFAESYLMHAEDDFTICLRNKNHDILLIWRKIA